MIVFDASVADFGGENLEERRAIHQRVDLLRGCCQEQFDSVQLNGPWDASHFTCKESWPSPPLSARILRRNPRLRIRVQVH